MMTELYPLSHLVKPNADQNRLQFAESSPPQVSLDCNLAPASSVMMRAMQQCRGCAGEAPSSCCNKSRVRTSWSGPQGGCTRCSHAAGKPLSVARATGEGGSGAGARREGLYCGAESSCWWEVAALAAHAHPSVTAMARTLLGGQPVVYDGDPLRDLALPAFLDKFVRRKQKVPPTALPPASTRRPLPRTAHLESFAGCRAPPCRAPTTTAQLEQPRCDAAALEQSCRSAPSASQAS